MEVEEMGVDDVKGYDVEEDVEVDDVEGDILEGDVVYQRPVYLGENYSEIILVFELKG